MGDLASDVRAGLRTVPARAGLVFLSLFIGFFAVTLLVSTLEALQRRANDLVAEFGAGSFALIRPPGAEVSSWSREKVTWFRDNLDGDAAVSGLSRLETAGQEDLAVVAADGDLARVRGWRFADGRALDALDVKYFKECVHQLLDGQVAMMPRFSFRTGKRKPELVPMTIAPNQPLIIEGIHGLNPALHEGFDRGILCLIYISQLTSLNLDYHNRIRTTDARLLRRIVRDYQFRSTRPEDTLGMWDSVRRGEERWIFPYQEEADIVFNSALHYELPILKTISYDILKQVPKTDPNYIKCSRILKILNYMLPVDLGVLDEIPPLSILREFIGGNTLYMGGAHT